MPTLYKKKGNREIWIEGDANCYTIVKDGNWLMTIRMNGELTVVQQLEELDKLLTD